MVNSLHSLVTGYAHDAPIRNRTQPRMLMSSETDFGGALCSIVDAGVWLRPFGNIIYLTPAFTISEQDLSLLTSTVVEVLRAERQD
jgi:adenosylmethionine-8-amino-7-oxononanoate aminotransferase